MGQFVHCAEVGLKVLAQTLLGNCKVFTRTKCLHILNVLAPKSEINISSLSPSVNLSNLLFVVCAVNCYHTQFVISDQCAISQLKAYFLALSNTNKINNNVAWRWECKINLILWKFIKVCFGVCTGMNCHFNSEIVTLIIYTVQNSDRSETTKSRMQEAVIHCVFWHLSEPVSHGSIKFFPYWLLSNRTLKTPRGVNVVGNQYTFSWRPNLT